MKSASMGHPAGSPHDSWEPSFRAGSARCHGASVRNVGNEIRDFRAMTFRHRGPMLGPKLIEIAGPFMGICHGDIHLQYVGDISWGYVMGIVKEMNWYELMWEIFHRQYRQRDLLVCLKIGDPRKWPFQWGKWWLSNLVYSWYQNVSNNPPYKFTKQIVVESCWSVASMSCMAIPCHQLRVQYENQGLIAWNQLRRFPSTVWRPDLQNQEEEEEEEGEEEEEEGEKEAEEDEEVKAVRKGQANVCPASSSHALSRRQWCTTSWTSAVERGNKHVGSVFHHEKQIRLKLMGLLQIQWWISAPHGTLKAGHRSGNTQKAIHPKLNHTTIARSLS